MSVGSSFVFHCSSSRIESQRTNERSTFDAVAGYVERFFAMSVLLFDDMPGYVRARHASRAGDVRENRFFRDAFFGKANARARDFRC